MKTKISIENMLMVERDYKGTYERGIMTIADFQKEFPGTDIADLSGQSDTLRPMVHIWYARPKDKKAMETFLTDMEYGLPDSDIESGNAASLNKEMFSKQYYWMFDVFSEEVQ